MNLELNMSQLKTRVYLINMLMYKYYNKLLLGTPKSNISEIPKHTCKICSEHNIDNNATSNETHTYIGTWYIRDNFDVI